MESSEFKSWRDGSTLNHLCPCIPGAGKSFMTAIVVNSLRENGSDIGVAVLYCSYMQQGQAQEKLLAGLLQQLVSPQHCRLEKVEALWSACKKVGRPPILDELSSLLQNIAATYSRVHIVVDALDECPPAECLALLSEIRRLQELLPRIRFLATFRPHLSLDDDFATADKLKIRANASDLEPYLNCNILQLSPRVEEIPTLKIATVQGIIKAADGM